VPERSGLVGEWFAAGLTLIVLLLTVLDTTHVVATTAGTTLLFPDTTVQTRIPAFFSERCCRSEIRKSGNYKQDEKRKES
jgi:hypothetical protein